MSNVARKLFRDRSGQALVEFALVVPIFMLLVMGVIEFGRAWNLQQTMTEAAREGARRAAVFDPTVTPAAAANAIKTKIQAAGFDSAGHHRGRIAPRRARRWPTSRVGPGCRAGCAMPYRFIFLKSLMNLANTSSNGSLTLQTATQMRKE
jgi:hypothetical protein